jgi:hypothetical protein
VILKNAKGISLVEVVIGSAIVLVIFSGLVSVFNFYFKHSINLTDNIKAEFLVEEGMEALRSMRDADFLLLSSLSGVGQRHLEWSGTAWIASSTPEIIDGIFHRDFVIESVHRDAFFDIASAGDIDEHTLKATVFVSWLENGATTTRSLETYFGNIFEI